MIVVVQNIAQAPLAVSPMTGPSFVDAPKKGVSGFLKTFLSDGFGTEVHDEAPSGLADTQHALDELNDETEGEPTDSPASGEPAILPPIAQFIAALPLPAEQSFVSTVDTAVGSPSAKVWVGDVGMIEIAPETPGILVEAVQDSAADADHKQTLKSDMRSVETSQDQTGQVQFDTPDAPRDAANIGKDAKALQFSASSVLTAPKVDVPEKTNTYEKTGDLLPATALYDSTVEPGQVHRNDPKPKTILGANSVTTDPNIRVVKARNPATISSAENAWRQKWVANNTTGKAADESTLKGNDGDTVRETNPPSNVHTTELTGLSVMLVSPTSPAEQAEPLRGSSTKPTSGVVLNVSLLPKSVKPTALIPKADDDAEVNLPSVDTDVRKVEDTSVPLSQPDLSAQIAEPRHMIRSALPSPSGTAMANLPATIAPTLVKMAKSRDNGPLELALSPEELGRLTILIKQDGHSVHVTMTAERSETLDLMRRHGNDLVADLRQAGFTGASLSFGHSGQDTPPRFARAAPDEKYPPPQQNPRPETTPTAPSQPNTGSGVDLRL